MDKFSYIGNADVAYVEELYQQYKNDPESVDSTWQYFFKGFDFSVEQYGEPGESTNGQNGAAATTKGKASKADIEKEISVRELISAYRSRAHLLSKTNPVRPRRDRRARLELKDFGLTDADLNTTFEAGRTIFDRPATLKEIIDALKHIYERTIGFEYAYIREPEVLEWFKQKIESESLNFNPSSDYKKRILSKLNEAVAFENFLHTKYIGQKRFSIEGGESTIPALDAVINRSAELGVKEVVIGMAHRGRLNVLVNIMGKTYEDVFNEFEGEMPEEAMGDGDVKYHLGFATEIDTPEGHKVNLQLAPNPSHLEAVDPLVEGYVRAKCDRMYDGNVDRILPILIHGDAAIAGQGLVYEITQMSKLEGYHTGGTIHFVINNQVGFTTNFEDARSSIYCTDVAKMTDSPVLHVNGDDPEAVVFCCRLAAEFREKFNRDIFIDLVCYRKHGHNESDEPKFTQPALYKLISKHPNPRELYLSRLKESGDLNASIAKEMEQEFKQMLQDRLNMVKQKAVAYKLQPVEKEWEELRWSTPTDFDRVYDTKITADMVDKIGKALTFLPKGFKPIRQIEKLLEKRKDMFFDSKILDWASAELLAYGSILAEGKIVRFSGQDVKRGTFSHRHAVLHDANTSEPFYSLDYIQEGQEKMRIYNSLLSEYGVLGFEFGYAMANPHALTIWEAQFGDFANGAQIIIDQFITAVESKWQKMNGLVMLLPHGYEGQGPEHSSARLERFLQMSAEYNIIVANLTTPANLFHILRRQLAWEFRKPLVIMSPKSLLRDKKVVSSVSEFTDGQFHEVIGDDYVEAKKVKKVLLCTGKIYYDLLKKQQDDKRKDVAIIRVEQLHPFPTKSIHLKLGKYVNAKTYWVQEEPVNMGAWSYIQRVYRYDQIEVIARKSSASPATGYHTVHSQEQATIIEAAFK
ncbi:2-oxoglutarate dehydrogenase E1 component [uncultured Microscilla sp.]|uniref:2-oxoglutarate dehydrogenase E1 component n=1 Tax=uncultured Microscilla sp. TaxID=432653 RepID=UPI0026380718|nr:2-oxoglutarate dehydrogenase E1 component [uncultured Microscilla sp.]